MRIAPILLILLTASLSTAEARPYWVFLADRGPMDNGLSADELLEIVNSRPAASWASRAAAAPLPDERDRALYRPYVRAVAALGTLRVESRWLNAVSVDLSDAGLAAVSRLPFVTSLRRVAVGRAEGLGPRFDAEGRPLEVTTSGALSAARRGSVPLGLYPYGPAFGQLEEIGVIDVHAEGYSGNQVRVMMLDTGFRKDHHAFSTTRLLGERDYVFGDGDTQNEPEDHPDQQRHGTGTWATAGGYDPGHIVGPGYGADFFLSKTEDVRSETQVEEDNYVAALEWADSLGVRVTSASLSYTCFDDGSCYPYPDYDGDTAVITRAIDIAASRGILCVNANGNYGPSPGTLGTPADADSMVACGAVDSLNLVASFSSRGPTADGRVKPEVVARGVDTWWADAGGVDWYGFASGTSLSTPLVGGSAALLFEAHPEWGPMDARAALLLTADRHGAPDNSYGHGRIDVHAAIHSQPILFPTPFSLVSPADGAESGTLSPAFVWRRSVDPDQGAAVEYTLHLIQLGPVQPPPIEVPAGTDTSLTLDFALSPDQDYRWFVTAEDPQGHSRRSRDDRTVSTAPVSELPVPEGSARDLFVLTVSPNPSSGVLRFRVLDGTRSLGAGELAWVLRDPLGRRVARGVSRGADGVYEATWDGAAESGRPAPAGVYYLEVRDGSRGTSTPIVRLGQVQAGGR